MLVASVEARVLTDVNGFVMIVPLVEEGCSYFKMLEVVVAACCNTEEKSDSRALCNKGCCASRVKMFIWQPFVASDGESSFSFDDVARIVSLVAIIHCKTDGFGF